MRPHSTNLTKRAILLTIGTALTAASFAQGWILTAPQSKQKSSWDLSLEAPISGRNVHATLVHAFEIKNVAADKIEGVASWDHLVVDDEELGDTTHWELSLAPTGSIAKAKDGDGYSRMLMPFFFGYPNREVQPGAKWSETVKRSADAKAVKFDYEVLERTNVGSREVFKISSKFKEDGANGMTGDDIFWVGKDGAVVKFELKLKNWVIPMIGEDAVATTTIKGEPSKGQ